MSRTVAFIDRPDGLSDEDLARGPLPGSLLDARPATGHTLASRVRTRLTAAYGPADARGRWRASFGLRSPGALDGYGHIAREASPLGCVARYVERFGGTDDPEAKRVGRLAALDAWLAALRPHWLESVGDHPRRERLVAWMDHDLRREADAWFALRRQLYDSLWANGWTDVEGARAVLDAHLAERGCGTTEALEDPLAFARAFTRRELALAAGEPDPAGLERGALLEAVMTELKEGAPVERQPPTLPGDAGAYAVVAADDRGREQAARETLALAYLRMGALLEPQQLAHCGGVDVCVYLHVPGAPVASDGVYDAERKVITWIRRVLPAPGPTTWMRASWPEPDVAAQTELWGAVRLKGEHLHRFVIAWSQLGAEDRVRGEELIADLRSSGHLIDRPMLVKRLELAIGSDPNLTGIASALANGLFAPDE